MFGSGPAGKLSEADTLHDDLDSDDGDLEGLEPEFVMDECEIKKLEEAGKGWRGGGDGDDGGNNHEPRSSIRTSKERVDAPIPAPSPQNTPSQGSPWIRIFTLLLAPDLSSAASDIASVSGQGSHLRAATPPLGAAGRGGVDSLVGSGDYRIYTLSQCRFLGLATTAQMVTLVAFLCWVPMIRVCPNKGSYVTLSRDLSQVGLQVFEPE